MRYFFATLFFLFFSFSASASWVSGSLRYNCDLSFQISGNSYFVALGFSTAEGNGEIRCYDYKKKQNLKIPVRARMSGIGAGVGFKSFTMSGGINAAIINSSPEALLGKYVYVGANGALGVGAGLNLGSRLSLSNGAFTMNLS
jgi:hypothetical protein